MDYSFDYLMFLAQAVTVVIAILIVVSMVATAKMRGQGGERGHLAVTKINDRVRNLRFVMEDALLTPQEAKRRHKSEQKSQKAADKQAAADAKKAAKVAVNDNAATSQEGDAGAATSTEAASSGASS